MDDLTAYAWIGWVVLILAFIIIEMLTLEFTFLMLALGSVGGLVSGLFGVPWWAQLVIGAVLSVLLLFALRPPLLRALRKGDHHAPTNVEGLLGLPGLAVTTLTRIGGQVRLANGETWTARLTPGSDVAELGPGDGVRVASIDGATAVVTPAERTVV